MFKKLLPVLLLAALALSACAPAAAATAAPTAVPTVGVTVNPSAPTPTVAPFTDEETPCKPFNFLGEALKTKVNGLPPVTEDDWVLGPDDALVTVIVYSDLQCPHCVNMEDELAKLITAYPSDVRLVYRHWLIFDNNDLYAARAAESAGLQGKFFEYKDVLFKEQSTWSPMELNTLETYFKAKAQNLGLDLVKFEADYNSDIIKSKIQTFQTSGSKLGFGGTPSIVVNGSYVSGVNFEALSGIVLGIKNGLSEGECPPKVVNPNNKYIVDVKTTKGDFTIELYPKNAPNAVNSFLFLANQGFYDGNTFYMGSDSYVMTGDATESNFGTSGYVYMDENLENSKFDQPGDVGAMNFNFNLDRGGYNHSIFFILKKPLPNISGKYINFGKVISGLDVVNSLVIGVDRIISVTVSEK